MSDYSLDPQQRGPGEEPQALGELEARLVARLTSQEAGIAGELETLRAGCREMWQRLDRLDADLRAAVSRIQNEALAEGERADLFREVWEGAALPVRLAFEQVALSPDHALQGALREAAALVDLWRKGGELESWVVGYPTLFLEAWDKISAPAAPSSSGAAERLAGQTMAEVRALLEAALRVCGIEWVAPQPGDPASDAHTVVGDVLIAGVPEGHVARCERPGLRRGGAVLTPAQVFRQGAGGVIPEFLKPPAPQPVVEPPPVQAQVSIPSPASDAPAATPAADLTSAPTDSFGRNVEGSVEPLPSVPKEAEDPDHPEWLRELERRSAGRYGPHSPVIETLRLLTSREAARLSDDAMRRVLTPLLPALGPGQTMLLEQAPAAWREAWEPARKAIPGWLEARKGLTLVAPGEGAPFLEGQMEAAEARRTAHPHEENTVARLEQVGVLRGERVLIPAKVIRYETGFDR